MHFLIVGSREWMQEGSFEVGLVSCFFFFHWKFGIRSKDFGEFKEFGWSSFNLD